MMRIVVTGSQGQLVRALMEQAPYDVEVVPCGRPLLELVRPRSVFDALQALQPDIIVSAAAYTDVDRAEAEPELAFAINRDGATAVAEAASRLSVPCIHISTDYVFGGDNSQPYEEEDVTMPTSVYGASKLAGEAGVRSACANHVILRTAWVFSPFGRNFLKTILRLAKTEDTIKVVGDQIGSPTSALDLASGIIALARSLLLTPYDPSLFGTFHMTGSGPNASWADFAETIVQGSYRLGGPSAVIERIQSRDYPTPVQRPVNSCLSNAKLARLHGIRLPNWQRSCEGIVQRVLQVDRPIRERVQ